MNSLNQPLNRRSFIKRTSALIGLSLLPIPLTRCGALTPGIDEVTIDQAWEDRASELEAHGELRTATNPGPWAEKIGGHLPAVSLEAGSGQLTVITSHGMNADHYITTLYIRNQDGIVIGLKEFSPQDPEAKAVFTYPKGTIKVQAFSFCNLHDHWMAEKTF